jgi:hypothetical protein
LHPGLSRVLASHRPMFYVDRSGLYRANDAMNRLFGVNYHPMLIPKLIPSIQPDGMLSVEKELLLSEVAVEHGTVAFFWRYCRYDGLFFDTHINMECINVQKRAMVGSITIVNPYEHAHVGYHYMGGGIASTY